MSHIQYSRVHRMMPTFAGLIVVFLVFAFVASIGFQGRLLFSQQKQDNGLLKTIPNAVLDLTKQPVNPDSGVTELAVPEQNKLPPEVEAWLQHLQKIEKKRGKIAMDQVSTAMVTMARMQLAGAASQLESALGGSTDETNSDSLKENSPASGLKSDFSKQRADWQNLITEFNSLSPPEECIATKSAYESALRETSAMMGDLLSVLEKATDGTESPEELIKKLNGMKGTSKTIDEAGKLTDDRVQGICDKYKVKKWFSISSDFGGGGLLSGGF